MHFTDITVTDVKDRLRGERKHKETSQGTSFLLD